MTKDFEIQTEPIDNGVDPISDLQYRGEKMLHAPQSGLTTASGGSLSTGGLTSLHAADSAILTNAVTRLNQLETKLKNLGLIK